MLKSLLKILRSSGRKRSFNTTRRMSCLSASLEKNKQIIRSIFDRNDDLVIREFKIGKKNPIRAVAVFLDSEVNYDLLAESVLHPLMSLERKDMPGAGASVNWLKEVVITTGKITVESRTLVLTTEICKGSVGIFMDGEKRALLVRVSGEHSRGIEQPITETVLRGSQDAFNEDIRTNLALVRKRLPTSRLAVESMEIGEVTKTQVNLLYLKGYVREGLIKEIKQRLRNIKVDGILESGQVEEFLQDNPYSFFSCVGVTERPDRVAAHLLEGKVALSFDNTPFMLIVPITLSSEVTNPDDYYTRYWFSSFIRLLRWGALLTALLGPAFYISIITFHQELLPTSLLMTILISREGVPFPGFIEAMIMELTFEILREAGLRLPRPFGQAISIVGAIVVGQAAVNAGLVSPAMVIVVSLTAIASFTIPTITIVNAIRVLRFLFMFAAASFGLFGIIAGLSALLYHLCSLRSFGVPYLSPIAPLSLGDLKDTFIRVPNWMMDLRPRLTGYVEPRRQNPLLKRSPPPPGSRVVRRTGRK